MILVNTESGELLDAAAAERRAEHIRLRLDAIADNYTVIMPMIREAIEKRDDMALGYRSPGEYVKDRFGAALGRLGMDVRREVVRELTEAGLSTRAIAPVVGVTQQMVVKDVAATRDNPVVTSSPPPVEAPTPPAVTGIDGKTYPQRKSRTSHPRVDRSRAGVEKRTATIAELAGSGHTSAQIAAQVGIEDARVRMVARENGIDIPADRSTIKTKRPESTRIAGTTVTALEGLAMGVELIDYEAVESDPAWAESLKTSMKALNRFANHFKEQGR
jgi:hypothetical protein